MNFIEITPLNASDYTQMKKHFGTTNNPEFAGYLLPDGTMLDFSGKHWGDTHSNRRQVDHRDLNEVWNHRRPEQAYEMINAIANGCIRLMPEIGGICLAKLPTEEQCQVLEKYIR